MAQRAINLNGLNIHYQTHGHGQQAVVLLHGWSSSQAMWNYFLPRLGAKYGAWAPDMPGHGASDKPPADWYSIPNFTDTLADFVQTLGLGPAIVVGHSMGGMITLNFAATYPHLVKRIAVINPVVTGSPLLRSITAPNYSDRIFDWSLRLSPRLVQPVLAHPLSQKVQGMEHLLRRNREFTQGTSISLRGSGHAVTSYDVRWGLPRITAPALVILGRNDVTVPNREGQLAAHYIPGARQVMFAGGHLVTDDQPEDVLRVLEDFFHEPAAVHSH